MASSNMPAESQNAGAGQQALPSRPTQHSRKRSYSNMSAEDHNTTRAERAAQLSLFLLATPLRSQSPPGTVRQRDWASGEAKEFATRQDLIVSEDWEAVGHQKMIHLLDLANDAWDEQDPAARQDKTKTVIKMQRRHCHRLIPIIYRDFDRLSDNLLRYQEKNDPADEVGIKVIRELLENLDRVHGRLKTLPANDELSWNGFYEAHRLVIWAHLLLGEVRAGFAKQERDEREEYERRNGLGNGQSSDQPREQESQQQSSSSQQDGQQKDHQLESPRSPIGQQSVEPSGEAQVPFWERPPEEW
ncbi:hypothetical protein BJ166DRAFT_600404 [Pestalotiopsis sp. NC0098]|nr:hypothetical protein BJ166DRAFT_600404 [Pestalotiopsis sp. NC0098]